MKLLIHDLSEEDLQRLFGDQLNENVIVLTDDGSIKHCTGCFECWIKTPTKCTLKDKYYKMGELLAKSNQIIVISKCVYGSFSPFVKNVFDRSISYLYPYFEIQDNELYPVLRYPDSKLNIYVWFYGEDVTDLEKEAAQSLLVANAVNVQADLENLAFVKTIDELGGKIF